MRGRMGGMTTVVLPIIAFWIVCAIVVVAICLFGELLFALAYRRRVRFSLRDLMLAATLMGVGLGLAVYIVGK